jgi:chromatin assembly factor 1 subunit A
MATSGMSYAVHYDLSGRGQDSLLQDFSHMRIEAGREPPVLYVAMASWIPKCNMYHHNCEAESPAATEVSIENPELKVPSEENVEKQTSAPPEPEQGKSNPTRETALQESKMEEKEELEDSNRAQTRSEVLGKLKGSKKNTEEQIDQNKEEEEKEKVTLDISDVSQKSVEKLTITPKKTMSPKQLQKKVESEKKRQQKQLEREEREKKKQEERERTLLEKQKQKQEKEELKLKKNEEKAKERELKEEQKRKEKEEKEAKRKEKEEREEAKRKERQEEKLRRQQELEEKNKEKQKLEEQKQKAAQAFKNYFVPKKHETRIEDAKTNMFMPFEVKSDMRLAPARRPCLSEDEKKYLVDCLEKADEGASYLKELKEGKSVGKCPRTWPFEDEEEDVIIIDEDFGESICEDKQKTRKMRVKFFKFEENRRPPYYGTWRKKSTTIKARRPFAEDKSLFDYEVDSDDDWEEEEQGESLNGSDDEEKENEVDNEDYEVDNEFFVPHGHLSDDEIDDEITSKLSPESLKHKLKLLKDEFDQDMQSKTNKIKPRSIGCIWYNKDESNVDEAIDRHLKPLAIITNGHIIIRKRKDLFVNTPSRKSKELREDLIPAFLKVIQGNESKKSVVVNDFIQHMQNNGYAVEVSKTHLVKRLKQFAQWKRCTDEGPMFNKFCWCVEDDIRRKYIE